jgi:hypothetical protein
LLNELLVLSRSLAARGIGPQEWHSWIKTFKKGPAIIAELDERGELARISELSAEEVARLRNIAPDNQKSFPGFNLNCPLLAVPEGVPWNDAKAFRDVALASTASSQLAFQKKDIGRLKRLLRDFPQEEIAPRLHGASPKLQSTIALLNRLATAKPEPQAFLHGVATAVVAAMQAGRMSQDLAVAILCGKPNKKKQKLEAWAITLILDVADLDEFEYRVADPAVPSEWSAALLQSEATRTAAPGGEPFVCALSGLPDSPVGEKMPEPNLKILGPTYLLSMNKNTPCQTRYGRTSTDIFAMGRDSVQSLNNAILHVTEERRKGKTWTGVPNGFKKNPDLLITYLEEEPDSEVPLAGLFPDVEEEPNPAMAAATYEVRTASIHDALRRLERPGQDMHVRVIALSQIDKGRKQVVFSGRYSTKAMYQGRDNWLAGTRNVPAIAIPFPVAKDKPAEWRSHYQPSPAEVMVSFKQQWLRSGSETTQKRQTRKEAALASHSVPGVSLGRIYALFLDPEASSEAQWLLDRYLSITESLLAGLACSLSGGASLAESARKEALIVIAVYGILLLRQGRTKEIYMEGRDYLLGQFLQMADLLHKLYCIDVRERKIPPQLIGNAAISIAMQRPTRAIEVLCTRMTVYLAWAERCEGENAGLAKWTRKELGRLAARLKNEDLNTRVGPNGKAELLLGYLANTKEKENVGALTI